MIVKVNRNACPAHLSFCERCLGRFLTHPMGYERRCFQHIIDDGKEQLTLYVHTGDNDIKLVLNEEERLQLAQEGWAKFVDFAVPMYRNNI